MGIETLDFTSTVICWPGKAKTGLVGRGVQIVVKFGLTACGAMLLLMNMAIATVKNSSIKTLSFFIFLPLSFFVFSTISPARDNFPILP